MPATPRLDRRQLDRRLEARSRARSQLRRQLPRALALARSALAHQGEVPRERLEAVVEALVELHLHLERVLDAASAATRDDQQAWGALLRRIRGLSWDSTYYPGGDPAPWRDLWRGLDELERGVQRLIRLESAAGRRAAPVG